MIRNTSHFTLDLRVAKNRSLKTEKKETALTQQQQHTQKKHTERVLLFFPLQLVVASQVQSLRDKKKMIFVLFYFVWNAKKFPVC